ncbi:hypothetical protein CKO28_02575 [Rhodovibrio sodomensis]|uniref:DeoxyPurine in DNA protein A domain-containing protein n=1 Tax=Rhodovibrio sodomensis TaxID=1088 RepID=A0ABS1D944_9PROT|nr:hypothetical protein [Rhodovibrio sodomensis]MBK1666927.1 hypothetical protein [Rhodovibrio sodomensis]
MSELTFRVGISDFNDGPLLRAAREMGAPLLVSANRLARKSNADRLSSDQRRRLRNAFARSHPNLRGARLDREFDLYAGRMLATFRAWRDLPAPLASHDVALDSAGFVAHRLYGDYLWGLSSYLRMAERGRFTWAAVLDFACEPEIAGSENEVLRRVALTARAYHEAVRYTEDHGLRVPLLPVLQGWRPEHYVRCYDLLGRAPEFVGLGSMCRRSMHGPNGALAIISRLDADLKPPVRFHLFGVKSQALAQLVRRYPDRIASADSAAWDFRASRQLYQQGQPKTQAARAQFLRDWYQRNRRVLAQALREPATDAPSNHPVMDCQAPASERACSADALEREMSRVAHETIEQVAGGEIDDLCPRLVYERACEHIAEASADRR